MTLNQLMEKLTVLQTQGLGHYVVKNVQTSHYGAFEVTEVVAEHDFHEEICLFDNAE